MTVKDRDHQLGVFIQGRLRFIRHHCEKKGLDPERSLAAIAAEARRGAGSADRVEFLDKRVFGSGILPTSAVPDWVDKVFLEAMTRVLDSGSGRLFTTTSKQPCISFEAGRFNAQQQAETDYKSLYTGKAPTDWLRTTFPILYRSCYGPDAAKDLRVEQLAPSRFRVSMANRRLEKASQADCSTVIGYVFGSLEKLGAPRPLVTHPECCVAPGATCERCVFEVSWG